MALCGTITQNITIDCDNPGQAGTEDVMTVINWEDWNNAALTLNGSNDQIIENIVLAVGKDGFSYQGKNNSNIPKSEFIKGTFSEDYNHEINFKVFTVNSVNKLEMEKLGRGRFVVIVANVFKKGDASFEVYGADSGLICTQNLREVNNVETGGAFDVILKSADDRLEPHFPKTLFDTDYATTKVIFDSLSA